MLPDYILRFHYEKMRVRELSLKGTKLIRQEFKK